MDVELSVEIMEERGLLERFSFRLIQNGKQEKDVNMRVGVEMQDL